MNLIQKIALSCLTVVMFMTTVGFTVNTHQCGGSSESYISLGSLEKSCCSKMATKPCPKGCCNNETSFVQIDTELAISDASVEVLQPVYLSERVPSFEYARKEGELQFRPKNSFHPPPVRLLRYTVLYQNFLI